MNKIKLVKVDPGKYAVKAECGDKKFYTKSLIDKVENVATESGYKVKFFNQEYVIGDDSIPFDYDFEKHKIETKILVNLAISKLVEEGDKVNLVVGMPIEHWLDRDRRAKYEQFIASKTQMSLVEREVDTPMNFKINKVVAVPESIGHVARNKKYKNRTVGILDCGGANFQGAIYKNGLPLRDSCFTLNEGGYFYLNSIKKAINSKFKLNYQDYQIPELIEFGSNREDKEEIANEITRMTKLHLNKVIRECRARNWNLDDMDIIVVGGGSNYFKSIICDLLPNTTISEDAIWDNVKGFGVLGEAVFGGSSK
ncbi:MAG: ParM/StbA family protein [Turicibacter sp.]|nr:ParM/StbA family protein [Turicibacter sp.]